MWEQIRSNRIRSFGLIIGMGILLLVLGYFIGLAFFGSYIGGLVIAAILWGIMYLVAYFQGESILLGVSGAKKITRDDHPRLYNIVEEMKIASGLYIIDDPAPNAFATGRSPERASVAVTTGLLQIMNRDELEGVIGHEISHIKNRDVLLMSVAGVILGTIVILAWYATRVMFFSGMTGGRRDSRGGGGGAQVIILLIGIVLMILAPIAAQLLYFAISRKREYLADASSALYTRYPEGLASALEKLAASTQQLKRVNQATAPMYTVNPFRQKGKVAADLTSTHPPISERIRILRAMAGAAPADYETAYEKISNGRHIVPASALSASGAVWIRQPSAETTPQPDEVDRARETSNALWRSGNYRTIDCECGARIRVPPSVNAPAIRCPRCGRILPLS